MLNDDENDNKKEEKKMKIFSLHKIKMIIKINQKK